MNTNDPPDPLLDLAHLSSAVGHHVINALSAIVSNAELIRLSLERGHPVDLDRIATHSIESALNASSVARRLIDYTRPLAQPGQESVALHALVSELLPRLRQSGPSHIRWNLSLTEVPSIQASTDQLRWMIELLTANSLEALRNHDGSPEVSISTHIDHRGWIILEIADNGCGMTPEVHHHAIEPFFTTKPGRLGVGLSIANSIWRRHRGTLAIETSPEKGTRNILAVDPRPH